ncbi:MAG: hypothetical protein NTV35_13360 [Chloroflexi bacterium]|nr:hypothetical protein [Chloroflexota bacterium]
MDDQHVVSAGTRRFSFEWFSSLPSYRSANRAQLEDFLRDVRLPTPWVGIDIACGVGLMSDLCQEVASRIGARLLGTVMIDRDLNALESAVAKPRAVTPAARRPRQLCRDRERHPQFRG